MKRILPLLWLSLLICGTHSLEKTAPDLLGKVCAFGDFNGDRNTDILVFINGSLTINYQETKLLDVLEASKFTPGTSFEIGPYSLNGDYVECSVGDFNGDSRLDVLVSIRDNDSATYNHTLWTSNIVEDKEIFTSSHVAVLQQHAMAIDVTNDGWTDILGFNPNGSLFCTSVSKSGQAYPVVHSCSHEFLHFPDSVNIYLGMPHLFVDLNSDLIADIVFMTKETDGSLAMMVWQHTKIGWQYKEWIPKLAAAQYAFVAAPVVMDFDSDGELDILVPICREADCSHITQMASWSMKKSWGTVACDLQDYIVKKDPFSLVVFRVGEFSLDSFPDITAIVQSRPNARPAVKVIENGECKNCEKNGTRRFDIRKIEFIQPRNLSLGYIKMGTFFDLLEDGSLDLLVEYEYNNQTRFGFIYCPDKGDTTFLKVQVFTGVCSDNRCNPKSNEIGSSISWTGACASFSMTDGWGGSTQSVACQVPASSHRALYLPFLLYGLGRSPNFVDELNIAIPKYSDRKDDWKHSLKQIVPNSRIIVLPPSDQYPHWTSRLYVTPSALIVQSLAVIALVCCMLLMVVVFLHYREKKEDRYERQQQSHRFHFDAM
ncbi:CBN-TAG-256 protein [Caenorhabditis brenneri]|uniref:CBN-TAG-256 protein n=1 Tax=Caenorhabditis brenneri TaxID=135651 RepID=G0MGB4_CAEBE|nr:CBN-TAG-256 protein [Caenorhabditis brenneri]